MQKMVIKEIRVDPLTVIRKRVPLEPDTCEQCGWNPRVRNKLGAWDHMTPEMQSRMIELRDEHKAVAHTAHNAQVVDEETAPQQWLGTDG